MDYIDIGGNGIYNEIIPKIKEETEMATAKKLPSGKWRVQMYMGVDDKGKYRSKNCPRTLILRHFSNFVLHFVLHFYFLA